jgi:hypothetical protein
MTRLLLIAIGAAVVVVLLKFGTVDPCGIVRAEARQAAEREGGFGGAVAAAVPDGVIDGIIAAQYGPLSPGRCIVLMLKGTPSQPASAQQRAPVPVMQPDHRRGRHTTSESSVEMLKQAGARANAAMMECKEKRLSGELKTHEASVECSNRRIIEAYPHSNQRASMNRRIARFFPFLFLSSR